MAIFNFGRHIQFRHLVTYLFLSMQLAIVRFSLRYVLSVVVVVYDDDDDVDFVFVERQSDERDDVRSPKNRPPSLWARR